MRFNSNLMATSPKVVSSTSNAEMRKIKKPLIERKRRERINNSLSELKMLVLEARNKDESCYSKMEKADILEMTVEHLRELQARRLQLSDDVTQLLTDSRGDFNPHHVDVTDGIPSPPTTSTNPMMSDVGLFMISSGHRQAPPTPVQHLLLGYSQCVQRVVECLDGLDLKDSDRQSVIKHLQSNLFSQSSPAPGRQTTTGQKQKRPRHQKCYVPICSSDSSEPHDQTAIRGDQTTTTLDFLQAQSSNFHVHPSANQMWRPWNAR